MIYQTQLEAKIFDIASVSLNSLGFEIVRIRLINHSKGEKILQFMIERLDGQNITLKNCEVASRHLSVVLDVENFIDSEYKLELSSTGINRPLTRPKDFYTAKGSTVKISTRMPLDGQKKFVGKLIDFRDDLVILNLSTLPNTVEINFNNIVEAQVDYFASNTKKGD